MTNHTFIHTIPSYKCEGGGVAQLPYTHQKTQLSHSAAPSKQSDGCAVLLFKQHPITTTVWQTSSSRMDNVKGGFSDMHCNPSLCQSVLM